MVWRIHSVFTGIVQVRQRTWVISTSVILIVLYSFAITRTVSASIDGQRVFWLDDDMMISMGYGRSLARGNGLVWYPGAERVEGYSNLGWVLIMALVHLLPLPLTLTSLPILIINVLLAVVILVLTARLIHRLEPNATLALPATLLALTISVDLAHWTIYGLEIPLLTALLLWLVLRVVDEAGTGQPKAVTFVLGGLLGIVRVDGVLLTALLCLLALWLNPNRRKVLFVCPLAIAFPLANVLFRLAYYGWPLPNTFYLRLAGWNFADRFHGGLVYVENFLHTYGILWLASGLGAWASQKALPRVLWMMGSPIFLYVIYIGGDAYLDARFFAPWLPIWFLLAFLTPCWLGWRMPSSRYLLSLGLLLATLIHFGAYSSWLDPPDNSDYARTGLTLRSATLPNTTIAVLAAGNVPYFAERKAFDLLGKNDVKVAHQQTQPNVFKPGHNKYDYDWSLAQYKPDLIVPLGWPPGLELRAPGGGAALDYLGWRDSVFFASEFQAYYAGFMLVVSDVMPVFVRADSAEFSRLTRDCEETSEPYLATLNIRLRCSLGK
jgi:hypothetical protein